MKSYEILVGVMLVLFTFSCESKNDISTSPSFEIIELFDNKRIWDTEFDQDNKLIILTSEVDTSVTKQIYSSYLPTIFKLLKKDMESGKLLEMENNFPIATKIAIDNFNNIWALGMDTLYRRNSEGLVQTITSGYFESIAIDSCNNVWLGNPSTNSRGLYKIDNKLNITIYSVENSTIPSNSISCIHINDDNTIWIGFRNEIGLLKITNNTWDLINSNNSNIPDNLQIESVTSDKNEQLYIAGNNTKNSVVYNVTDNYWTNQFSRYNGIKTSESIEEIHVFHEFKFAVSWETSKYNAYIRSVLLMYQSSNWYNISESIDNKTVINISTSPSKNLLVVSTTKELYQLNPIYAIGIAYAINQSI